jgi:hypothetical protein
MHTVRFVTRCSTRLRGVNPFVGRLTRFVHDVHHRQCGKQHFLPTPDWAGRELVVSATGDQDMAYF